MNKPKKAATTCTLSADWWDGQELDADLWKGQPVDWWDGQELDADLWG